MIFLTIGTQEPFDRLVRAVDDWAARHDEPVFGQLGVLAPDSYRPRHFSYETLVSADSYEAHVQSCRLLVGHAGMGSIITALTHARPLLILPRKAALGEHRNDHQWATAQRFEHRPGVNVVWDEAEVGPAIDRLLAEGAAAAASGLPPTAAPELVETLRRFIHAGN